MRKCSLIGLYFFEHLTFQATQIGKLAANKVPKVEEGLSRTTRKRRKTGLKRAKNTHFAPKMHGISAFFLTVEGAVVLRAGTAGWGQFLMRLFSIKPAFRSQVSVNASRLLGSNRCRQKLLGFPGLKGETWGARQASLNGGRQRRENLTKEHLLRGKENPSRS
jgi:hypothetical protein